MKTLMIIGLIAMLLLSVAGVMAEDAVDENASEPSLISEPSTIDQETSDAIDEELNGSVSPVDEGMTRLKLWFTFNQEKKAELELKLARMELVRARIAAKNNNTNAMEKALEAHNKIIAKVQERINKINVESTKEKIKETANKLIGLERAIQVHEARIAKLNEILANENLTTEQMAKIQNRLDQAENNTAHLKDVQAAKIDKIKTRLMAIANLTQEDVDKVIEDLENAQNLSEVKQAVKSIKEIAKNVKEQKSAGSKQDKQENDSENESDTESDSSNEESAEPGSEVEPENETEED